MIAKLILIILGIILYVFIALKVYNTITKKWTTNSKIENIYFSAVWPLLIPCYIVWLINKLG